MKYHCRLYSSISQQMADGQTCLSLYWWISRKLTQLHWGSTKGVNSLQYQTQLGKSSQAISGVLFHREKPQRKSRYEEYLVLLWWNYSPYVWTGVASLDSLMVCLRIFSLVLTVQLVVYNMTLAVLLNLLFHCSSVIMDSISSVHLPSCSISISPQSTQFCEFSPCILYVIMLECLFLNVHHSLFHLSGPVCFSGLNKNSF